VFPIGFSLYLEQRSSSNYLIVCQDSTFIWRNLEGKWIRKETLLNSKQRYIGNYNQQWELKENPWLILADIYAPAFCFI